MSFPTTSILDNFNRADETPVGNSTWTGGPDFEAGMNIVSNQLTRTNGGSSYWSASTFGPDCEAYIDIITRGAEADAASLWLRANNPNSGTLNGYKAKLFFLAAGDLVRIQRYDNDGVGLTSSDYGISPNLVSGDALGFEIIGANMTLYKRVSGVWSALGAAFNETTYSGTGYIGVGGNATPIVLDNFGGGTVVTAGGLPPVPASRMVGVIYSQG